ncbi:MAG: amino acid ABC transporter substrate-binding protein [Anaerolineales bacterium]|nr:amino acid ABC transporter substrate-binding protein [Anaerolineales bacterium]
MKHWKAILALLMLAAMVITSCAPAPEPTATPKAAVEKTITIGYTASLTGSLEVSAGRQAKGLKLWMEQVNEAGGVVLSDGTIVKFKAATYDDESNKERVQELYTRLATEDNADLLISPYSSGLTAAAAVISEQYGKVMITTGAASDEAYKQGYTQIFQIYTPASRYMVGAVDLLAHLDPSVKKIAVVHENDKFSTDVANATQEYAGSKGYEIVLFEGYDSATTDFGPFINKIVDSGAEAIMGGGHFMDGSTFARQAYEKGVDIKFFAILVAPPEPDFAQLGEAAYGIIGPSQWEPLAAFTAESAKEAGLEWYGPSAEYFIQTYEAAYDEEPSYHSAGGYAAGVILQKAIEDADSTDSAAIKAALDKMQVLTFYGGIKFDITPEAHGLQIGHSMVYIQWQKDGAGNLMKQVVWPLEGATAETIYPIP